jgi:hypothetical protein
MKFLSTAFGPGIAAAAIATAGIAVAASSRDTRLVNICLRLPHVGTRVIAAGEDDELWILVGPERDDDWNLWIQAISRDWTEGGGGDEWVVCRTAWWWGEFDDEWLTYF